MSKKFIYGIAAVKFGEALIGYIEKNSWDWGGTKPESVDVEAEQVPDAPVLTLMQSNGKVSPTFNLIQLDYANLKAVLGGTLVETGTEGNKKVTGWKAPTSLVDLSGKWTIDFVSGVVNCFKFSIFADHDHSQRHYPGQSRRQADPDRSVEGRMPAEGEQARGRRCSL